jgi:competence protein ComEA
MERKFRYVWWGVLCLLAVIAIWKFFLPHNSNVSIDRASTTREIVVYVSGAVEKPGLVHLPVDARLNDALKQVALLSDANLSSMNPAEKLKDGQKITVPYKPAPPQSGQSAPGSVPGVSNLPSAGTSSGVTNSPGTSTVQININTAGITELDKLPGIGPALAERIIQYRNEQGAFGKPEDLQNVTGIGAKTYEKMASMVSVGP